MMPVCPTRMDFSDIERRFLGLLNSIGCELLPSERKEVTDFIDVGEYGLALETLAGIVLEEKKELSHGSRSELIELAKVMGLERSELIQGISGEPVE